MASLSRKRGSRTSRCGERSEPRPGGWCYRETAAALRAAGHTVFTPTHTGVGERFHQSAENITLETHIRDVCGCIEWEELKLVA